MIEVDKRVLEEYMVCSFDLLTTFSSTYITCILFTFIILTVLSFAQL